MRKMVMIPALALLLAIPFTVTAGHDPTDTYTFIDVGTETLYVDDDPYPYVYLECNAREGMQRQFDDGNQHGHPGHHDPDCLIF